MKRFAGLVCCLSLVAAAPVAARDSDKMKDPGYIGARDVGKGVNFYSIEKEIALGRQLAQDVEKQSKLVDDPVISEYVNRVAQNIARNSDLKLPATAKVIDDPQVNAFALPGGFIFVNSGLVLRAGTESELAGVIAHELAHVAARHGTRQASRGQVAQIASLPLIFLGGWTGYAVQQAAGLAVPLTFLKFSRDFEREADVLGLQYMYAAGYDPTAFVDFFEKLQAEEKKKPGTLSDVFRSHPPTEDRIKEAQKNIQNWLPARSEYVVTTSEFSAVRERLESIHNRRPKEVADDRPTLRRKTDSSADPVEIETGTGGDDDERPTLKRRTSG